MKRTKMNRKAIYGRCCKLSKRSTILYWGLNCQGRELTFLYTGGLLHIRVRTASICAVETTVSLPGTAYQTIALELWMLWLLSQLRNCWWWSSNSRALCKHERTSRFAYMMMKILRNPNWFCTVRFLRTFVDYFLEKTALIQMILNRNCPLKGLWLIFYWSRFFYNSGTGFREFPAVTEMMCNKKAHQGVLWLFDTFLMYQLKVDIWLCKNIYWPKFPNVESVDFFQMDQR